MFEARLAQASILKKVLDALKELVSDVNFECNDEGLNLQAMDNSHVALVSVKLEPSGFLSYRCDRPMPLGTNLVSLTKVLKCAKDDDQVTLKANDNADVLHLKYEAKNQDRIAEYEMKLMDIDSDTLGIPDTEYDAHVTMPSAEFARICRDLNALGESVRIEVSKEGIRFASDGEAANGSVLLKQSQRDGNSEGASSSKKGKVKKEEDAIDVDEEDEDGEEKVIVKKEAAEDDEDDEKEEEEEEDAEKRKKKKKKVVLDDDEDAEEEKAEEGESEVEGSDAESESEGGTKKRKRRATESKKKSTKKPKKEKADTKKKKKASDEDDEEERGGVTIQMTQPVNLTFSLKYLVNFSKSSNLCQNVKLMMSNEVPLMVQYDFNQGHIQYYLAPKIGDE
ncbi:hypothetical protein BOTBODRAFT_177791 [Botryobasidium botryosum FD-172 SS1]|uniref:DNA sliding clamp PCNA n=1 Tax=Botryobasidium botryosum (strain FD-172 SS1) TaxID=930990 RepID=A0A067MGB3_BOTB1|nr:hypothetical protein BOTBODRAFT_177791 [Botryobasidium botryosum FD-172 SS1]